MINTHKMYSNKQICIERIMSVHNLIHTNIILIMEQTREIMKKTVSVCLALMVNDRDRGCSGDKKNILPIKFLKH